MVILLMIWLFLSIGGVLFGSLYITKNTVQNMWYMVHVAVSVNWGVRFGVDIRQV